MTALCGVALAVLASLQQVHALCVVTGCVTLPAPTCQTDRDGSNQATCCCCHQAQGSVNAEQPIGQEHESDSRSDSPCHQDCWCCQPSPPQQQHVGIDTVQIAQPSGWVWDWAGLAEDSMTLRAACHVSGEVSPTTAHELCASLCRFLI